MDESGLGLLCFVVGDAIDVSSFDPIAKSRGGAVATAGRRGRLLEAVVLGDAVGCVDDITGAEVVRFS